MTALVSFLETLFDEPSSKHQQLKLFPDQTGIYSSVLLPETSAIGNRYTRDVCGGTCVCYGGAMPAGRVAQLVLARRTNLITAFSSLRHAATPVAIDVDDADDNRR